MRGTRTEFELIVKEPGGVFQPRDVVECGWLHCRLSAEACVRRQVARWPGQRRAGDGEGMLKAPLYEPCGSGKCKQGEAIRYVLPPDFVPAPPCRLRDDIGAQWAAYRRWRRTRLQDVPDIDHPPGGEARGRRVAP